ncbi:MAG: AAA-like domain-containing protein, partial [Xenococcus sp. (in: cyanobacteria)]
AKAFAKLQKSHRRKKVLLKFLNNYSDEEIANALGIQQGTVRKQISDICNIFEIKESPGYPKRTKLITLFAKYMPDLIGNDSPENDSPKPSEQQSSQESKVNMASDFYITRPVIENDCYQSILQPGSLLRLKAPQQMGKTMLLNKVLEKIEKEDYRILNLNFGLLLDTTTLSDYSKFLKAFCLSVGLELGLENKLIWEDLLSPQWNSTNYFQDLLTGITHSLVLALDKVDLIFELEEPEIAQNFCELLRGWHENARRGDHVSESWQKLRLVVVHSTDIYSYSSLDINFSPLANVGVKVELPELTPTQIQELAQLYGLTWGDTQIQELMNVLGGHPYLVQTALRHISNHNLKFSWLLATAPTEAGIYSDHLREHLVNLKKHSQLINSFREVVQSKQPVRLESEQAFKLDSMGLVQLEGNEVSPRCNLYRWYFYDRLISGIA